MSLDAGSRIAAYEILALLGRGGMGEVYRARDTKLNRDVAIKILPDAFAADAERVARFEREAQVLASLNHPHIAAIYGLEETGGSRALVLELVEGPTLAERIEGLRAGGLGLEETIAIARQIADALGAAHEQGIIHRDLKPANVKLRPDGTVKVLDFGLAKAFDASPGTGRPSSVSMSPTLTAATNMGVILGTAAYMAPEQARGKTVDKRADVWAFGCVVYEMLTGRRAFAGEEVSDTLAFVITKEIEWDKLPADTPTNIRRLLRRCLEKDPRRRLRDIADARIELDDQLDSGLATPDSRLAIPDSRPPTRWRRVLPAAAVVVASVVTGASVWMATRPTPANVLPVQRYPITLPAATPYVGEVGGEIAISPDGRRLVYPALDAGKRMLFMRTLDQLEAQPIRGTEDAYNPFFSPDGEWIGFFTAGGSPTGKLKKIAVRGGPPLALADTSIPTGAWLADDTIVFARTDGQPWSLYRIPAAGGAASKLASPDTAQKELRVGWPEILPGGKDILISISLAANGFDESRIAILSIATGKYQTVIEQGYHARYVSSGHIIYALGGNLMAVPFDLTRRQTTGPPVPIVEGVRGRSGTGEVGFAVSSAGFLVYAPGGTVAGGTTRTLAWVDRSGREEPIAAPPRNYMYPRLSPDGTRVALDIRDQESDIWIWDLARESLTRLTFEPGIEGFPVWAPDGRRVYFSSQRSGGSNGNANLYWQAADGTGQAEHLLESKNSQFPQAVSPDGTRLVFRENDPKTASDINMLSLGDRRATALLHTAFAEQNADVSPDGRWLAYESNESGTSQIYVRPFPEVDRGRWQVSTGGGTRPVWARSGRELFYLIEGEKDRMMAVPVQGGGTFSAGNPQVLWQGRYLAGSASGGRTYDVSSDAQRFLMIKPPALDATPSAGPSFVFVLNVFDELKRLAPPKR